MNVIPEFTPLRIGQVAEAAGVNVQTLRYYERRGLLTAVSRRPSGYRAYSVETIGLIRFIKRAQELGFTLDEIAELLALRDNKKARCSKVRHRTRVKIDDIDRRIEHLTAMKRALAELLSSCTSNATIRSCPIIEALSEEQKGSRGETK